MIKRFLRVCGICVSSLVMMLILLYTKCYFFNDISENFVGKGTKSDPYLIDSLEKLEEFRDAVNDGESFYGKYFLQTTNINLRYIDWIPIGIYESGNYFCGIYDGGGHYVENIHIGEEYLYEPANVGFFGMLGGTVKNFGIESGIIKGDFVGSICSHQSETSLILNCYNKADLIGIGRAGGICDNFGDGSIINCVNLGKIIAPTVGEIVSYTAGYVTAVYPNNNMPSTYKGEYYLIELYGKNEKEMLNNGLDKLVEEEIISRKDVTWWR